MKLLQGMILADRYEIIERIGLGGMAVVYRAKDRKLERDVTVKVMREEYVLDEEFLRRFNIEARSAASLSNNNIVNVYDVGKEDDINFIVMEYIDGLTLKEIIEKKSPFDNEELIGVTIQIAQALSHAHKNDIIHRDIKPQNIMVTKSGIVKVMDFGIAKAVTASTTTNTSNSMGSVHYFSPEQARGKFVDLRSDIYSLGVVMYEMATGQLPFEGDSLVAVALKHINEPLPDIKEFNPDISASLEKIILKATSKISSSRYSDIEEMIVDLKRALKDSDYSPTMVFSGDDLGDYYDFDSFDEEDDRDYYDDDEDGFNKKSEKKVVIAAILTAFSIIALIFAIVFRIYANKGNNTNTTQMPSLMGRTQEDAVLLLKDYNLEIITISEETSTTFARGLIISQTPNAGSIIKDDTEVSVVVSIGQELVSMPSVVGKPWNDRLDRDSQIEELFEHNFRVSISVEHSNEYPENTVFAQEPKAGTMIEPGSHVTLFISRGVEVRNVAVPSIVGRTLIDAERLLANASLMLGTENFSHSNDYPQGQIMRQLINPGAMIAQGTSVDVLVSLGPAVNNDNNLDEPEEPEKNEEPEDTTNNNLTSRIVSVSAPNRLLSEEAETISIEVYLHKGSEDILLKRIDEATIDDFPFDVTITGEGQVALSVIVDGRLTLQEVINLDE